MSEETKQQDGVGEDGPKMVGKYRLDKKLGEGGMGVVWLGHHPDLGIPVAIKTVKANKHDNEYLQRFLFEARSAALINHFRVARIYDAGTDGENHFIVMEYLSGGNIRNLLKEGPLDPVFALYIVQAVAEGLAAAAKVDVVHRDIKPDNIMLDANGEPKLVDLGLAKQVGGDSTLTATGAMMGTPTYIAPEQATGAKAVDTRADIYSLGATLYHFVTGETPYQESNPMAMALAHCMQPTPDPHESNPSLPGKLCALIVKMMAKEPDDRYQSPDELLAAMEPVIQAVYRQQTAGDAPGHRKKKKKKRKTRTPTVPAPKSKAPKSRPKTVTPPPEDPQQKPKPSTRPDEEKPATVTARAPGKGVPKKVIIAAVAALLLIAIVALAVMAIPKSEEKKTGPLQIVKLRLTPEEGATRVGRPISFVLTAIGKSNREEAVDGGEIVFRADPADGAVVNGNKVSLTGKTVGPVMITVSHAGMEAVAILRNSREYLAIDVSAGPTAKRYPIAYLDREPADLLGNAKWKTTTILLRRVPAGTFTMGAPDKEWQGILPKGGNPYAGKETAHKVTLTKPFYVGVFPVTQAQWEKVMGNNPSNYKGAARPVEQVSYEDIRGNALGAGWPVFNSVEGQSFTGRLRARTGIKVDLPTEAQWEYACRAGTQTSYWFGDDSAELHKHENYREISSGEKLGKLWYQKVDLKHDDGHKDTSDVGAYKSANNWGLYDLHGNVRQWCLDWHKGDLGTTPDTDPTGPRSSQSRSMRGGSCKGVAVECRSASRPRGKPSQRDRRIGFRLAALDHAADSQAFPDSSSLPAHNGKPADMSRPVQVFIMMGEIDMIGTGHCSPESRRGTLTYLINKNGKFPHLLDSRGARSQRNDVRYVQIGMKSRGKGHEIKRNEWLTFRGEIGPELQFGHVIGNAFEAPVLLVKVGNGNRSLGWDLLPPGSKRFTFGGKHYAGYKESPRFWAVGSKPKPVPWYAGKQYDMDVAHAKHVLGKISDFYPGARGYEIVGFVYWQGVKDLLDPAYVSRYEQNLERLIKVLRKDYNAPKAKFVCATYISANAKKALGNAEAVVKAQLAVDGGKGVYPEFAGNVASVDARPFWRDASVSPIADPYRNNGNAETFVETGNAMGWAMLRLLGIDVD